MIMKVTNSWLILNLGGGPTDGLPDGLRVIQDLAPSLLIHGHAPLTELFTIHALPGLMAALGELDRSIRQGMRTPQPLVDLQTSARDGSADAISRRAARRARPRLRVSPPGRRPGTAA